MNYEVTFLLMNGELFCQHYLILEWLSLMIFTVALKILALKVQFVPSKEHDTCLVF